MVWVEVMDRKRRDTGQAWGIWKLRKQQILGAHFYIVQWFFSPYENNTGKYIFLKLIKEMVGVQ